MKSSSTPTICFLSLLLAPRLAHAQGLESDPETDLPCDLWHDNVPSATETCEEVRDYWNITPEQFTRWNPSVGLDCKPWRRQSYCVVPFSRYIEEPLTTTITSFAEPTTTATSATLRPSPTAWEARGCYEDEDEDSPVMEKLRIHLFDTTIQECQSQCYVNAYDFAGLKGDECWCSSKISGERAKSTSECDTPCSGDDEQTCGGEGRISVYEAEEDKSQMEDGKEDSKKGDEKEESEDDQDDQNDQEEAGSEEPANGEDSESGAHRYRAFFGII